MYVQTQAYSYILIVTGIDTNIHTHIYIHVIMYTFTYANFKQFSHTTVHKPVHLNFNIFMLLKSYLNSNVIHLEYFSACYLMYIKSFEPKHSFTV